jgi:hypothetical protein
MLSSETDISSFCNHRIRMTDNPESATQPNVAPELGVSPSRSGYRNPCVFPLPYPIGDRLILVGPGIISAGRVKGGRDKSVGHSPVVRPTAPRGGGHG